jgi:hypothetical protein
MNAEMIDKTKTGKDAFHSVPNLVPCLNHNLTPNLPAFAYIRGSRFPLQNLQKNRNTKNLCNSSQSFAIRCSSLQLNRPKPFATSRDKTYENHPSNFSRQIETNPLKMRLLNSAIAIAGQAGPTPQCQASTGRHFKTRF